jgi:hypothetical protein
MQADVEEDRLEIADFACWDILLRYYGGDAPDDGLRCVPKRSGRAWTGTSFDYSIGVACMLPKVVCIWMRLLGKGGQ